LNRFVLDCSVSAAWCLKDEGSDEARRHLDLLGEGEAFVPPLWIVEMTNVLVLAERKKRVTVKDAALALDLLERLPIVVVDAGTSVMRRVLAVARRHGLTAYDASYLDLALERQLPLASLDSRLRAAAKAARVPIL
jgi:predicted nucleic acid-binding protein